MRYSGMPFRFFVPLPGPFVYVGKSKAERIIERRDREEREANMTTDERARRFICMVILFWLLATSWAGHYFTWHLAVAVAGLGLLHVKKCTELERTRKAAAQAEFERLRAERN